MSQWKNGKEKNDFYIKNGLAFTEKDDILITNILVKEVAKEEKKDNLKAYFECFGEINSVTFNDIDLCNFRTANIIFKSPLAAANALTNEVHTKFAITANDSWLQPLLRDYYQQKPAKQSKYITDLNDDTLLHLMKLLSLKDQLALVCSNARFMLPFEMFAKSKLKVMTTDNFEYLSEWQIQKFFKIAGDFFEKFNFKWGDIHFRQFSQLLTQYCPNLKVLMASQLRGSDADEFNRLLYNKPNLKELLLYYCPIRDECSATISNLPKLEALTLVFCDNITGRQLIIPNLKELNIFGCDNLDVRVLYNNILKMPALNVMTLSERHWNSAAIVKKLPKICKNLEVLSLDCQNASYRYIYKLEKLRRINFLHQGSEDFLEEFVQKRADQIEWLGIDCFYFNADRTHFISEFKNLRFLRYLTATDAYLKPLHALQSMEKLDLSASNNITNEGLLELVKCCLNLKYVNIENSAINNDFDSALIPVIKSIKRPNGLLTFFVYKSEIKQWKLSSDYNSVEMKSLVKFDFRKSKGVFPSFLSSTMDSFYYVPYV